MIESVLRDLRYGFRTLRKSPTFAMATVATLAIGLALVTVVFTVFNAYVLRPFAVRDPYSLHALRWRTPSAAGAFFQWREYQDLRTRTDLFDAVLAERTRTLSSSGARVAASFVSGDYFESLGARMQLGRSLASFDASAPGSHPVAVLSHDAWSRLFAAAPDVVGRSIDLNGRPFEIVGVLSESFQGLDDSPRDLWVPVTMYPEMVREEVFGPNQSRQLRVTVRLRRSIGAAGAAAALGTMMSETIGAGARAELEPQATPARLSLELLAMLSPVFAAFALVLAAASANVSNIMLARAAARARELGIRLSIGASRARIVRQLVTEGLILGAVAAAGGLVLATVLLKMGTAALFLVLPPTAAALVRVVPLDFDYRVFTFTAAAASAATILFALVPALQATRVSMTQALRGDGAGGARASRLRSVLVAGQVVVSMGLLIGAATLLRNGQRIQAIDIGFDTAGVSAVQQRTSDPRVLEHAATALAADARVERVAAVSSVPLLNGPSRTLAWTAARPTLLSAAHVSVSPEFFSVLDIPIVQGRTFRAEEAAAQAPIAIVNAGAARALWPGEDPIGQIVRITDPDAIRRRPDGATELEIRRDAAQPLSESGIPLTVVGVAGDAAIGMVFESAQRPMVYLPTSATGDRAASLLVRGRPGTTFGVEQAQTLLRPLHADPLAFTIVPVAEGLAMQMFPIRVASWIGLLLSAIALALSVSGLYGVVSYTLSQRTRELGIRMALGATSRAMVRLVMRQSARLVAVGGAIGVIVSFAVTATIRAFVSIDTVAIVDVGAFAAAAGVLASAAAIASYLPARRAATIHPASTLRGDG